MPTKHVLSDIEADGHCWCSECGPSRYFLNGKRPRCRNAQYESIRRSVILTHGLTAAQAAEYIEQHGPCNICGSTNTLIVDHDHTTRKIRGVLCWHCNTGLGKLGDSIEGLEKALAYLKGQT